MTSSDSQWNSTTYYVGNTTWGDSTWGHTLAQPTVGPQPATTQTIHYAPLSDLPPVPEDVAEDDLAWLDRRVTEIEDYSRLAA